MTSDKIDKIKNKKIKNIYSELISFTKKISFKYNNFYINTGYNEKYINLDIDFNDNYSLQFQILDDFIDIYFENTITNKHYYIDETNLDNVKFLLYLIKLELQ